MTLIESIDAELWQMAEERMKEILWIIQPAPVSEQQRNNVIKYLTSILSCDGNIEVLPYGSVPLKTYIPDGDIDLTLFSTKYIGRDFINHVFSLLRAKAQNFMVIRDVKYVDAQVKLVKCYVENISVDISFNQMAGLSALCFMEEVDRLIGKNHLFKRSMILIKAWCYYENRILGAADGYISTYALEVLILYIFNVFNSSLCGPLAVLYKFLDYYSRFDWDKYCVSINGPIDRISHPTIRENDGGELFLSHKFMRKCRERYLDLITTSETTGHEFLNNPINIVDPLANNNNLGRSVWIDNFLGIKEALLSGAQRLREILLLSTESMGLELESFFQYTLSRNGKGIRRDVLALKEISKYVPVFVPSFGCGRSDVSDLNGDPVVHHERLQRAFKIRRQFQLQSTREAQASYMHRYQRPISDHTKGVTRGNKIYREPGTSNSGGPRNEIQSYDLKNDRDFPPLS